MEGAAVVYTICSPVVSSFAARGADLRHLVRGGVLLAALAFTLIGPSPLPLLDRLESRTAAWRKFALC